MPVWSKPPEEQLHDALREVWAGLDSETAENPSFDTVVGLQSEQLTKHAIQAVAAYLAQTELKELQPDSLIHVYTLGFVVGMKYGEGRAALAADHIT